MAASLPISALLSYALVAFTIEIDNEFEHRTPHRTTASKASASAGPWLASWVMYSNFLQYVPASGITEKDLRKVARVAKVPLDGLRRWGYVRCDEKNIRPTGKGELAKRVWSELPGKIEARWQVRFGESARKLRLVLEEIIIRLGMQLPAFMPILGYALRAEIVACEDHSPEDVRRTEAANFDLASLLAKALLALTVRFEETSPISLAMSEDILRVIPKAGTPARDLPRLSGVSKEAIKMGLGVLSKRGLVKIGPNRIVSLTHAGFEIQGISAKLLAQVEKAWSAEVGLERVEALRRALQHVAGEGAQGTDLLAGIRTYPEGWRAGEKRATLPRYPMVLHRGGYPDGS